MTQRPALRDWFTPQLIGLHLFALAAIAVCLFMGSWQLGVYDQRQDAAAQDRQQVAAVPLDEVWAPGDVFTTDQDQRRVEVRGVFRPAGEQLWVTDRVQGSDTGVWLVAPVTVDGAELMVVRGWADAVVSPPPPVPTGEVSFTAVLQPGEASAGDWDAETRTIGSVRIPTLLNELGYERLWSGYAIADDSTVAGGLATAEIPEPDVSWTAGGRNLGYGLQWWVFAAFAAFMWWRMSREMVANARSLA